MLMNDKKDRISSLDGLRGICAFAVAFMFHFQLFDVGIPFQGALRTVYDLSWLSVDIFFCISGFAISLVYEGQVSGSGISFEKFMYKRIKHIYPLMYITLAVCTLEQTMFFLKTGSSWWFSYFDVQHFVLCLLGIQSGWLNATLSFNGPAWSISVEMFLYILFFCMVRKSKGNRSLMHLGEGIMIVSGLVVMSEGLLLPFANTLMARGVICFFGGMIIRELYVGYQKKTTAKRRMGLLTDALVGGVILIWFWICHKYGTDAWIWGGSLNLGLLLVFDILIAPVSVWLALTGTIASKLLNLKLFRIFGNLSFEIYLWHFPVLLCIKLLEEYDLLHIVSRKRLWICYFVGTMAVAVVYKVIVLFLKRSKQTHHGGETICVTR